MESKTAYPLCWPHGRARVAKWRREKARFETTFARARDEVIRQIQMMVGSYSSQVREANIILSTNVALRRDGLPLAGQREPDDAGVAVYFNYKKRQVCFACDRWNKVEDNLQAIAKTIDALRGIARWGTGDMLEAAFTGFTALPDPAAASQPHWREVLDCPAARTRADVDAAYRVARSRAHPDRETGSDAAFNQVQVAYEHACREFPNG